MRSYWLHDSSWTRVVTQRVRRPNVMAARLGSRRRPEQAIPVDGKLLLIAANQLVDPRSNAVVPRRELLDRLVEALSVDGVDGVIGSADILEELVLLNVLEDRLAICDHRSSRTGVGSDVIVDSRFDAARFTTVGIETAGLSAAVSTAHSAGLPVLIELIGQQGPDGSVYSSDWLEWVGPFDRVTRSLSTGKGVWFLLPAVPQVGAVASANAFPVLLRDTDIPIDPDAWRELFDQDLPLTVRGLVAGPSALFPLAGSVEDATKSLAAVIHQS